MAWAEYVVQDDVRATASEKYENNAVVSALESRDIGHVHRGFHVETEMPAGARGGCRHSSALVDLEGWTEDGSNIALCAVWLVPHDGSPHTQAAQELGHRQYMEEGAARSGHPHPHRSHSPPPPRKFPRHRIRGRSDRRIHRNRRQPHSQTDHHKQHSCTTPPPHTSPRAYTATSLCPKTAHGTPPRTTQCASCNSGHGMGSCMGCRCREKGCRHRPCRGKHSARDTRR